MIVYPLLWLGFLGMLYCHPHQLRVPEFEVSSPEAVNTLERGAPYSRSINLQTISKNNIEVTIKEVEQLIKLNPTLPRLTRGEILDLLENITSVDAHKVLDKNRDPKAIMVVMPYTPSNVDEDMQDLYTKAPVTHIIGSEPDKPKNETKKHRRRRPPVNLEQDSDNNLVQKTPTTTRPSSTNWKVEDRPEKRRPEITTERPRMEVSTYHPKSRRPTRTRTSPTKHPNHKYPEEEVTTRRGEFVPSNVIRIIESPKLVPLPQELKLDYSIHQETASPPVSASLVTTTRPYSVRYSTTIANKPIVAGLNLPDNLSQVVKDLNLESALETTQKPSSVEEAARIKELLASIGVVSTTTTTTTATSVPDIANVAESLSPDMRNLLMTFGLIPDPNAKPAPVETSKYYPEKAEVKPDSYVGFKPLPDDVPGKNNMDALLASFGLGRSSRKQKAINNTSNKNENYNFDMIPDNMKGILVDLGLSNSNRQEKKIRTPFVQKTSEKQHVFNPDTPSATEEELKKLEILLNMIKQLEQLNGTASDEDLKKIDMNSLKELVSSLNGNEGSLVSLEQKNGGAPDPNQFDTGLSKNEVKRQESTTTSTTTTPTTATTSTTTTSTTAASSTTTEEAKSQNLLALEASFGGQSEATTEASPPETTTPRRRTGFYYLVDWNTFLDIDDQKGKRVNLRFQPTVGDPKRFLAVTVP